MDGNETHPPLYHLEKVRVLRGEKAVLDVDDLRILAGEPCAVVGPNGAGKTTLLRLLAFLVPLDEGVLRFRGQASHPNAPIPLSIRRNVTLVMQQPYLFSGSVWKNIVYGLKVRGVPGKDVPRRAEAALERMNLMDKKHQKARTLSGGEAKRLAIARAVVLEPEVLLLDEPTADVDEENRAQIEETILQLHRERKTTVVLSTHDDTQAKRVASRFITLSGGRLQRAGPMNPPPHRDAEIEGALATKARDPEAP
ncbi:MAG: ATP-binding cassette domain-containing protein [Planctomycetota bacterium]|jgi:tungstate transport system ATP-binding protein